SLETRLKSRHEYGGGNAFAGNIGDGEDDSVFLGRLAWARENVVVVAGDRIRGAGGIGQGQSGNLRRRARKKPGLDLARDLQVSLHYDAIGNFEHEQHEQEESRPEVQI